MGFVWSTALKDLRRHLRDPAAFGLWLGIPLVVGVLMVLATGGRGGSTPQAHLLVADNDDSFLSGLLIGALSQGTGGELIRTEQVGEAEGRVRMNAGDATALLIIPDGFARAALKEEPVTLELVTNPSQRILPGIVEEGLSIVVDASFYLHRILGKDLREFAEGPPAGAPTFADSRIAAFSVKINQLMARLGAYVSPPVVRLETTKAETEEPERPNFAILFLPGVLYMALLFMAQGLGEDLWQEKLQNTLRRVVVSPRRVPAFLFGKLLAGSGLMLVVSLIAMLVGRVYFGPEMRHLPLALGWAVFSGTVLTAGMMAIQVHATSRRGGNMLTMVLIFPLMMAGGSFFPFEIMPDWMAAIGRRTPNGWALQQLKVILLQDPEPWALGAAFLGLVVAGGAFFMLSAWRVRHRFAQG